jgi:hypothetical protein
MDRWMDGCSGSGKAGGDTERGRVKESGRERAKERSAETYSALFAADSTSADIAVLG